MCVCVCRTRSSVGLLDRIWRNGQTVGVTDEQEGDGPRKGVNNGGCEDTSVKRKSWGMDNGRLA